MKRSGNSVPGERTHDKAGTQFPVQNEVYGRW